MIEDKYRNRNGKWRKHPEWTHAYLIDTPAGTPAKTIKQILLSLHPGSHENLNAMVTQAITGSGPSGFGNKRELVLNKDKRWAYAAQWMIDSDFRPKDWIVPISRYMIANKLDLI